MFMNWVNVIFQTIGGLALFLYGMHTMSDGLKASAGDGLRRVLANLTKNRVMALLVGTLVTMTIQSSSATTVMTVGFANAGLLTFRQAISLILGANIGTTFTAWIVSLIGKFKIAMYALPAIGVGFFFMRFIRKRKLKNLGTIFFGFGLLFFGLDIMKEAFKPLGDSQMVIEIFSQFSANPLLGVLVGTVFTMLLQSSSATIAIVQALALSGVISFDAALPLILGDNIGTTITAELAAIGSNATAERTARAHTLFNVIGTVVILPFIWIGVYGNFIQWIFPGPMNSMNIMMHIALAHSMFNIINAILFTALIDFLIRAATALSFVKEKPIPASMMHLKESFLADPLAAMQQMIAEIVRMAEFAKQAVARSERALMENDEKIIDGVFEDESTLDEFQAALTKSLITISERHLDARESREYPILLHSINDLEKVGDYAANIASYALIRKEKKFTLHDEGLAEIRAMFAKLYELFDSVVFALHHQDGNKAREAISIEDEIDEMKALCRENHIVRLNQNDSGPEGEMMIMDLATNIEKMGDHLVSIAKAVGKDLQWGNESGLPMHDQEPDTERE
jgi:phosphate:Na+ symporter